jgi:hypothetical protein
MLGYWVKNDAAFDVEDRFWERSVGFAFFAVIFSLRLLSLSDSRAVRNPSRACLPF